MAILYILLVLIAILGISLYKMVDTRSFGITLLVAFFFSEMLFYLDSDTQSIIDLFSIGSLLTALVFTVVANGIISLVRYLRFNTFMQYFSLFIVGMAYMLLTGSMLLWGIIFFLYLAAINVFSELLASLNIFRGKVVQE